MVSPDARKWAKLIKELCSFYTYRFIHILRNIKIKNKAKFLFKLIKVFFNLYYFLAIFSSRI